MPVDQVVVGSSPIAHPYIERQKTRLMIRESTITESLQGQIGKLTHMSFENIKSILLAGKVELNTRDQVQNIRN